MHVLIVGAGIAGLSCAFKLSESDAYTQGLLKVTVLEASGRVGGIIETDILNDCILESGPDSFITNKPYMLDLAARLGISKRIIPTEAKDRGAMVVSDGKLQKLPEGFTLLAPTKVLPFLQSPMLSWSGKIRALCEIFLPAKNMHSKMDESLADFVRRRFGRELFERLAQPMVAGIYVGDAEKLSASMTAERFVNFEQSAGSVIGGLMAEQNVSGGKTSSGNQSSLGVRYGLFCSFDRGMQFLVDTLVDKLKDAGVEILLNHPVKQIVESAGKWQVADIVADHIVLAVPAAVSARLIKDCAPELEQELGSIEAASSAVINMIIDWSDIGARLDAFGVVVPEVEMKKLGLSVIALSFASKKFSGRAPGDYLVLRAFVGGSKNSALLDRSDDELCALVIADLVKLIGYRKGAAPSFMNVRRWPNSMPQFHVGHRQLLARIESKLESYPHLGLAGASYRGVGLPECVNSGELCAEKILKAFTGRQLVV